MVTSVSDGEVVWDSPGKAEETLRRGREKNMFFSLPRAYFPYYGVAGSCSWKFNLDAAGKSHLYHSSAETSNETMMREVDSISSLSDQMHHAPDFDVRHFRIPFPKEYAARLLRRDRRLKNDYIPYLAVFVNKLAEAQQQLDAICQIEPPPRMPPKEARILLEPTMVVEEDNAAWARIAETITFPLATTSAFEKRIEAVIEAGKEAVQILVTKKWNFSRIFFDE